MLKDRRRATDARVIGILLAHPRASALAEREGIFRGRRVYFFLLFHSRSHNTAGHGGPGGPP